MHERNWMTAPLKAGSSFQGGSLLLSSSFSWYSVKCNTCYICPPSFLLPCYSQVATIFTFVSDSPVELIFSRRHRSKSCPTTLPNCSLSWVITELESMILIYRTIIFLFTDLFVLVTLSHNSIRGLPAKRLALPSAGASLINYPQAFWTIRTGGGQHWAIRNNQP